MPLCGSSFCGCAVTSVPADFAEIAGAFPTIDVAGNGTGASPWNLTLNDEWAGEVAGYLNNIKAARVNTLQGTTSLTYADLATVGPSVTCTTGSSALILLSSYGNNTVGSALVAMSFAVSGATTLAATDANAGYFSEWDVSNGSILSDVVLLTALNPGINTFTAKYRTSAGTANFAERTLAVIPLL